MKPFLLILSLTFLASCTLTSPNTPIIQNDKMMKQDSMKMERSMSGSKSMKKDDAMMKPTGYVDYDEASVKSALAAGQRVVLFFHAPWCPTCKALNSSITADRESIPADTLIVKVDYDTSTVLKAKYGVVSQHTTVVLDKNMALISKKLGARSVSEVLN